MADKTSILELDPTTFAEIKANGYIPVSVSGKTYKMPLSGVNDYVNSTANSLGAGITTVGNDLAKEVTRATAAEATKANAADLAAVATSGSYSDLSGVPTNTGDFTNNGEGAGLKFCVVQIVTEVPAEGTADNVLSAILDEE